MRGCWQPPHLLTGRHARPVESTGHTLVFYTIERVKKSGLERVTKPVIERVAPLRIERVKSCKGRRVKKPNSRRVKAETSAGEAQIWKASNQPAAAVAATAGALQSPKPASGAAHALCLSLCCPLALARPSARPPPLDLGDLPQLAGPLAPFEAARARI
jgi:hypothetical protein